MIQAQNDPVEKKRQNLLDGLTGRIDECIDKKFGVAWSEFCKENSPPESIINGLKDCSNGFFGIGFHEGCQFMLAEMTRARGELYAAVKED